MMLDPSEAKPPVVYTPLPATAAASSTGGGPSTTGTDSSSATSNQSATGGGATEKSSNSNNRTSLNISPPPQVITMSAAAGGVVVGGSKEQSLSSSSSSSMGAGVLPTYLDQSAYLFLLCTIACAMITPQNEKQLKIISDLALDLEVKIPPYLRLAVVGGFGYAAASSSSASVTNGAHNTLSVNGRIISPKSTFDDLGSFSPATTQRASTETMITTTTTATITPSAAGSIAILSSVLRLVAARWCVLRPKFKDPDNLLKQILVSGVLRDVTVPIVRSASISALATAFVHQIRGGGEEEGNDGCGDPLFSSSSSSSSSPSSSSAAQLWEMLKLWFNTPVASFHPFYVWRGSDSSSSSVIGGSTGSSGIITNNNNNTTNTGSSSPTSAVQNINSKLSSETHRYMLIHLLARVIQVSPSDVVLNDGMLKILPLAFIAIDPHSPSRAEREACLPAVASLLRVAVRYLPNVSFQQKFQRIVVGCNSGSVVVFDVKSTDELAKFDAFEPNKNAFSSSSQEQTAAAARKSAMPSILSSSKSKRSAAASSSTPSAAGVAFSEGNPPPAHAVAAVAYSNIQHDVAVLSWDLQYLRIFHASGAGAFFLLNSNHSNFKLKREILLPPRPPSTAEEEEEKEMEEGESEGFGKRMQKGKVEDANCSSNSKLQSLTARQIVEQCSLVWLSPQCVEVTSPWHDKLQATI